MKIIFLILILIIIFFSNYATLKLGEHHYNNTELFDIFDISHKIFPDLHKYEFIIQFILFIGLCSLYFVGTNAIINEYISKMIIILLIRAFTIISTILPKHEKCEENINISSFFIGGCYDKIFSGHTSAILLLTLIYFREHIINIPLLVGINLLNIFMILSSRYHYTVDVLLAIFVTSTIYTIKV